MDINDRISFYSQRIDYYGRILDDLKQEVKAAQIQFDNYKALFNEACEAREAARK